MLTFDSSGRYVKLIKHNFCKPRGVLRNPRDNDPFVRSALKMFDKGLYADNVSYTRAGGDVKSLQSQLASYDRKYPTFSSMTGRSRYNVIKAFEIVRKEFELPMKVIPKWIYSVEVQKNKSSGYPHFRKKGDILDELFSTARMSFHKCKYWKIKAQLNPVTLAMKGKLSLKEERKTRLVWHYPGDMTICEGVFAQPLIEAYYHGPLNDLLLTGKDAVYKHQKLAYAVKKNTIFYGLDFSQYDSTVPPFLINMAFQILCDNIEFGAYEDENEVRRGGRGVTQRAYDAYWTLVHYFIHTPFVAPTGHLFRKVGGIPSGSHFTNLVGSIITRILITWLLLDQGLYLKLSQLRTNGDDSAFCISYGSLNLEDAAALFKREVGMILKPEKTVVARKSEDSHISGSFWFQGKPTRPDNELFRLALCPISHVKDANISFNRLIGIWLSGGFMSQKFCQFFEYFQSCYDLLPPSVDLLDWKLRWLGFGEEFLSGGINYVKLYSFYL